MPPIFTTTSTSSNIVTGVVFDFGNKAIAVPPGVGSVDAQWIIDHCRLAEESVPGVCRPAIVSGSGKITIDIDSNGNPVRTGVVAILNGWKISTLKTSGSFTIKDIYEADNSIPYLEPAPVPIRYQQTIGGTIVQDTGAGGGATPAQIWNYSDRTLTAESGATLPQIEGSSVLAKKSDVAGVAALIDAQLLDNFAAIVALISSLPSTTSITELKQLIDEIYLLHGLKQGSPLLVTSTQRKAGGITQAIASTESQTTVTRQ